MIDSAHIVFFSGTGCTTLCVNALKSSLEKLGVVVSVDELHTDVQQWPKETRADTLIIMFPVHSFDAPLPIFEYLELLQQEKGKPAAIIAVSGGGEMITNRACCLGTRRALEHKGYTVTYEAMFVMPCNTIIPTPLPAAIALLKKLPVKADEMANDLANDATRRIDPPLIDRLFARLGSWERAYKPRAKFSKSIKVSKGCSSCGQCSRECPRGNIEMRDGTPDFQTNCVFCLRCIYGCPNNALSAGYGAFMILKDGFALKRFESDSCPSADELRPLLKGFAWKGVREYLSI